MYSSDYITRTIKQFSDMLAAILFGTHATGQTDSYDALNELSLDFTGLGLDVLTSVNVRQLLNLYSLNGELDVNKVYVSGRLLYQLAEQDPAVAQSYRAKALELFVRASGQAGGFLNEEHKTITDELMQSQL